MSIQPRTSTDTDIDDSDPIYLTTTTQGSLDSLDSVRRSLAVESDIDVAAHERDANVCYHYCMKHT